MRGLQRFKLSASNLAVRKSIYNSNFHSLTQKSLPILSQIKTQKHFSSNLPVLQPSNALSQAYEGKTDSLEKFMSKAYPPGPKNAAEYVVTTVDKVVTYIKRNQLWILTFGLACCAVEMMHAAGARYDMHRFNIIFRASPRQARVIIVAGTLVNNGTSITYGI